MVCVLVLDRRSVGRTAETARPCWILVVGCGGRADIEVNIVIEPPPRSSRRSGGGCAPASLSWRPSLVSFVSLFFFPRREEAWSAE